MDFEIALFVFVFVVGLVTIIRSLLRYEDSAYLFGRAVALRDTVGEALFVIGLIGLGLVTFLLVPDDQRQWVLPSLFVTLSLAFWLLIIRGIRQRLMVGRVLIDLGRHPVLPFILVFGVLMIIVAISEFAMLGEADLIDLAHSFFILSYGALAIFAGLNRTLITEAGIFSGIELVGWHHIQGFELRSRKYSILRLKSRHLLGVSETRLFVPSKLQEQVRTVLHQRLS